jgi:class 3 adenylate cyclase
MATWRININEPESVPRWFELRDGKTGLGRSAENQVVLQDVSASRYHAEIVFDSVKKQAILRDLNSTNGTYLNRQRIEGELQLSPTDIIRIGQAVIYVAVENETGENKPSGYVVSGTHRFTRELLLESLDEHSILLYEIARRLNMVTDIQTAVQEITTLLKRALSIDECTVIPHQQFSRLQEFLPTTAALQAIRNKSAEVTTTTMFVPVMGGDDVLGLMYLSKTRAGTRPFGRRDLQLAIAVSHQAALTIQRIELLEKLREQQKIHQLLYRFVPPAEAEYLIKDYLRTGHLPGLREDKVTILFSDIEGSTALAERVGVHKFANILNKYYNEATAIIFKFGGTVRYLGDGIMAIFEDRHVTYDHLPAELRAVRAGRDILDKIRSIDFGADLQITIGVAVNTGVAMVGYIGTEERMEFNAIGDVVNVAFRMQDFARPYRLVIGPATMATIVDKYQTQRIGAVSLRGREKPVQVYEVLEPVSVRKYSDLE